MGAYRGLAFIIGSEIGYTSFDGSYTWIGTAKLFGIAAGLLPAVPRCSRSAIGLLMHRTVFGRRCYAVGSNRDRRLGRPASTSRG